MHMHAHTIEVYTKVRVQCLRIIMYATCQVTNTVNRSCAIGICVAMDHSVATFVDVREFCSHGYPDHQQQPCIYNVKIFQTKVAI